MVQFCWDAHLTSCPLSLRYLFTLDLPEYWENKHADQTLEVLMSDLDPAIMDQFYMKDGVSASDVTHVRLDPWGLLDSWWSLEALVSPLLFFLVEPLTAVISDMTWLGGGACISLN